jgi:hypothetical protein
MKGRKGGRGKGNGEGKDEEEERKIRVRTGGEEDRIEGEKGERS